MDIEQKQSELIDHFVKRASAASDAAALSSVLVEATSHPSLFAFSEILALPNLLQLEATENSAYLDMLRLFAHGTWNDYKSNADRLPQLIPDQILKLKQLTVLTLAETYKNECCMKFCLRCCEKGPIMLIQDRDSHQICLIL